MAPPGMAQIPYPGGYPAPMAPPQPQSSLAPTPPSLAGQPKLPLWLVLVAAICVAIFLTGVVLFVSKSLVR
jgi:hypothetical protein